MQTTLRSWLICLLLLFIGYSSHASTIKPSVGEAQVTSVEGTDLLEIQPSNEHGISYNHYKAFSVSDSPLKILNLSALDSNGESVQPANLIIIESDYLDLSNTVEIVGPPVDILFLSTNRNGRVSCTNCELKGFSRATFATAQPATALNSTVSKIGGLFTSKDATLNLKNLQAPGIYQLEVLSKNLVVEGTVNINTKVNNNNEVDPDGSKTLGAGTIEVYEGDISWNYSEQTLLDVNPTDSLLTLSADIYGVDIAVTTSGQLKVAGTLNTKVDLLSASAYKGQDRLPSEKITLQAFGSKNIANVKNVKTSIAGNLLTSGSIFVRANNHLEIEGGYPKIESAYQEYAVTNNMTNKRKLFAHDINVAAMNVDNQGVIEAGSTLSVHADKNLVNHFGGELLGDIVQLQSSIGFVRNGSRTPFKSSIFSETKMAYKDEDLMLIDAETSELGTFYHDRLVYTDGEFENKRFIDFSSVKFRPVHASSSAYISGRVIRISTSAFENINPYWESVATNGHLTLDSRLSAQVAVVAQEELKIGKGGEYFSDYILNSSAMMFVSGQSSQLDVKTKYFINQRYRHLTLLESENLTSEYHTDYGSWEGKSLHNWQVKSGLQGNGSTIKPKAYTYSPAAHILAMGDVSLGTSAGFVNETSFVEIYGDAKFGGGKVYSWGIEQSGIEYNGVQGVHEGYSKKNMLRNFIAPENVDYKKMRTDPSFRRKFLYTTRDLHYGVSKTDTLSVPSLFLINGNVVENGPQFYAETLDVWKGHEEKAMQLVFDSDPLILPDWFTERPTCTTFICPFYYYTDNSSYTLDGGKVILNWDVSARKSIYLGEQKETKKVKTETHSYIDVLLEYVEKLGDLILELFNEIKWWD